MLALGAMKRQTLLPSLLWICLLSRLVYPTLTLNTILTNIFFPLGKMIGMMRSQTSFILSSQSWQCRKDEVVFCHAYIGHTHLTHSYILRKYPPPRCEHCQCILAVRHILVECNHFAQKRKERKGNVLFNDALNTFYLRLYAPSHRQDCTYPGLCYTSCGALAGTRNSMGPPHEGSIRWPIAPWTNMLT